MLLEYKLDLRNSTSYEELKEGNDIVINTQYSSEKIGGREFLSFPHGLLVKDGIKNEAVFIDNDFNAIKVTGIDVDKLEWALPYSLAGSGTDEDGLIVKLKDGRVIRIVGPSDSGKKKDKYRFAFVGNYLVPLYRNDFSKKKLEKIKDKIFIFGYPYYEERRNARKKLLDFLKSKDNSQVIYTYEKSISEPIDRFLAYRVIVFKKPRKFSTLSLENVEKGIENFRVLISRSFSAFKFYALLKDSKEVHYESLYIQKFLQEGIKHLCK